MLSGPREGTKGIRPRKKQSLNSKQGFGSVQWTGVLCHQGWLPDQRMAQLAEELGEVCPGKSSQQKTGWAGAGQQGWCASQTGS